MRKYLISEIKRLEGIQSSICKNALQHQEGVGVDEIIEWGTELKEMKEKIAYLQHLIEVWDNRTTGPLEIKEN